ncbi:MAG: hypothetical protein ACYSUR_06410 [Planctomycetota bacterium]
MTGMLALIIASACLGAAGTYAAVQIEDEALKTLLMTKADLLREQALLRFDTVAQELDRTKPFVDDGLVTMSELDELRCQVAVAQTSSSAASRHKGTRSAWILSGSRNLWQEWRRWRTVAR